jgi:hypothetical protein
LSPADVAGEQKAERELAAPAAVATAGGSDSRFVFAGGSQNQSVNMNAPVVALVELTAADVASQVQTAHLLNRRFAFDEPIELTVADDADFPATAAGAMRIQTGISADAAKDSVSTQFAALPEQQSRLRVLSNRTLLMKRVLPDGAVAPTLQQVQSQWPQARVQRVVPAGWNLGRPVSYGLTPGPAQHGAEQVIAHIDEKLKSAVEKKVEAQSGVTDERLQTAPSAGLWPESESSARKYVQQRVPVVPATAPRAPLAYADAAGQELDDRSAVSAARQSAHTFLSDQPAATAPASTASQPASGEGVILVYVHVAEPEASSTRAEAAGASSQPATKSAQP